MFGGSVCAGADLLPPAGDGWQSRAAVRDGNAMPLGSPLARGCTGIPPASLSVAAGPVVDESLRNGPMGASAPTTARAARSEAERAERGAGQMRSCNPMTSAPAPRESTVKSAPHHAAPVGKSSQTRRHHLTPTPVQRGEPLHRSATKAFFLFGPCTARFSFGKTKEKWGVHWDKPAIRRIPRPMGRLTSAFPPRNHPQWPARRPASGDQTLRP